jgi:hypothetical protein
MVPRDARVIRIRSSNLADDSITSTLRRDRKGGGRKTAADINSQISN